MTDPFAPLRDALSDRFEFREEIGRGGMAAVFRAVDRADGSEVAVKVLLPELTATLARERFLREIRVEAALEHPRVVPVVDSGEAAGFVYLVLGYVGGESLHDKLAREGPLPLDTARAIFRDVAEALGHAHAQGVVHRDVKPANILLGPEGALVTDFGIARAVGVLGATTITDSGLSLGTPTYMSPEQAGESKGVDGRADVYSLGCVLFEMLAGEPPFHGHTAQTVMARHMLETVPRLSLVRPGVPPTIERAVEKALAKVPADRFQSMADFVSAVFAPDSPTGSRPSRTRVGVTVTAVVVAVAAGGWGVWTSLRPELDPRRIVVFPLTEIAGGQPDQQRGEAVALAIVSALETTDPLIAEDGYTWLSPAQRADVRSLSAGDAAAIARSRGAMYLADGDLVQRGDSVHVILRLRDLSTGRIERRTEVGTAGTEDVIQSGLRAVVALLPEVLEEGRDYDLPGMLDRDPAGVALWMLGNRAYRSSQFEEALGLYERALEADPRLSLAALRAAPAASWQDDLDEATRLVEHALRYGSDLPPRHVDFAVGLASYLRGRADSAVARLRSAITADTTWTDAWMALGEVHRHLLPASGGGADSALAAFEHARRSDPDFTPPLYHIAEIEGWRARADPARRAIAALREAGRPASDLRILTWVVRCVTEGMTRAEWRHAAQDDAPAAFEAASSLALSREHLGCASDAFEALLGLDDLDEQVRFGRYDSALALQTLLLARGLPDSAAVVLQRAIDDGEAFAAGLWVVDETTGAPTGDRAEAFLTGRFGDLSALDHARMPGPTLWLLGQWTAHRGDVDQLSGIAAALRERADADDRPMLLWRDVIDARLVLARGDSAAALARLAALRPTATRVDLLWSLWEPLAGERITEAELLLAQGRPDEAARVAAEIDHPASIIALLYLPRSMELRIEAAEQRGEVDRAAALRNRLALLRSGAVPNR